MTVRHVVGIDSYTVVGAAAVIAGGGVAAVAGPLDLAKGSWLAAYLVLVCGVSWCVIGAAQQRLSPAVPRTLRAWQMSGWLVANGLVIIGSLVSAPLVTDAGSVLLFATLLMTAWMARPLLSGRNAFAAVYVAVLLVLAVSIPIGSFLAHSRA